jgi:hypothetical protein
VVKRHLRHRGLAPPSDVACPAYKTRARHPAGPPVLPIDSAAQFL